MQTPDSYHLLMRGNGRLRAAGELLLAVLFALIFGGIASAIVVSLAGAEDFAALDGAWGLVGLCATLAALIPATKLAARVVGRPPGELSSITGRLRWRLLLGYVPIAFGLMIVLVIVEGIYAAVTGDSSSKPVSWPGLATFLPLALLILVCVPIQAAAEEYAFRGTLMQFVGVWTSNRWIAIVLTGVVFAAAHGMSPQVFVVLSVVGVTTAWVTIRTGGLEAAIAMHAMNNVVLFGLVAASGGASTWLSELNTDIRWPHVVFQSAIELAFAAIVARRTSAQRAAPGPDQIEQHAAERRLRVEHADDGRGAETLPP